MEGPSARARGPTSRAVVLLAVLMAASLCAFDGGTHRTFFVPKLLLTYATAAAALWALLQRPALRWPSPLASAGATVAFAALALLALRAPAPDLAWIELSVLGSAAIVLLCVAQLDDHERRLVVVALAAAGTLQLAIALGQALDLRALLPAALHPRPDKPAFGSVGNPEFLATLLGAAGALGFGLVPREPAARRRRWAIGIAGAVLLGLLLARNKGGVALVLGWGAWRALGRWPRARPAVVVVGALLAVGLVSLAAPASAKGRVLLWLASARMIADHPWLGVGAGQVRNAYLPAVQRLFAAHPQWAATLGSYTAQVDDAHDLILQGWASLGLPGLASALALLLLSWRIGSRSGAQGLALAWLAGKSLYTVVLGSLSGTLLWAVALGLGPWRWRGGAVSPRGRAAVGLGLAALLLPAALGVRLALADRAYYRGLEAQAAGEGASALAAFEEASEWQPSFAEAHLGRAYVHFGRGEREQMQEALASALRLDSTMDVIKISAHMRFYSHLYAEAEPLYAFLHDVFPEHLTSMAKLALIRLEAGDLDGARAMARELLATRPRHRNFSDADNREVARRVLESP